MTAKLNITANGRDKIGSAESRRLRKQNQIPAVIYDKDNQTQFVSFDIKEFEKEYKKGGIFTTLITLEVGDKKINVITHNIDFDPLNDRPTHVEFLQVNDNQKVKTKIKVKFIGQDKSPGIKKGGFLNVVRREVEFLCDPNSIPAQITFDVSKLKVGDKVRIDDLDSPENSQRTVARNFMIASVTGRRAKDDEDQETVVAKEGEEAVAAKTEDKK